MPLPSSEAAAVGRGSPANTLRLPVFCVFSGRAGAPADGHSETILEDS